MQLNNKLLGALDKDTVATMNFVLIPLYFFVKKVLLLTINYDYCDLTLFTDVDKFSANVSGHHGRNKFVRNNSRGRGFKSNLL